MPPASCGPAPGVANRADYEVTMGRWRSALLLLLSGVGASLAGERPTDIVDAATIVSGLKLDMRYAGPDNFVGRPIVGYRAEKCLLTKRAAEALKRVQEELNKENLSLKVYDCYRPQSAVDDFARWGSDSNQQKMKAQYYPDVSKRDIFRLGYVARRSGHSRGSTVDLTIVPLGPPAAPAPVADVQAELASCEGAKEQRAPDDSLDMGTGYDCFSKRSHTGYAGIGPDARKNRRLLKSVMGRHGFVNLPKEWWHYTLADEPYPKTYFDFPVE